jgi:hypothetical protein
MQYRCNNAVFLHGSVIKRAGIVGSSWKIVSWGKYAMTCVYGNNPIRGVIFLYHLLSGRVMIVILLE